MLLDQNAGVSREVEQCGGENPEDQSPQGGCPKGGLDTDSERLQRGCGFARFLHVHDDDDAQIVISCDGAVQ